MTQPIRINPGRWRQPTAGACVCLCLAVAAGCDDGSASTESRRRLGHSHAHATPLSGRVAIDGSSTVYRFTAAAARQFRRAEPRVWIRVDLSSSSRGLDKLVNGRIDVANASRRISADELATARQRGLNVVELAIARDGVTVVVSAENTWVESLSIAELGRIWRPKAPAKTWREVRPEWPDVPIEPCSPSAKSGTVQCFTEAVLQHKGELRPDRITHEDEHVLIPYVGSRAGGIAFMGMGWLKAKASQFRVVPLRLADGAAVAPSEKTVRDGAYGVLSRTLYLYTTAESASRPDVSAFLGFCLRQASTLVEQAGYVSLSDQEYARAMAMLDQCVAGRTPATARY